MDLDAIRHQAAQNKNGVPANSLTGLDIISDSLQKQIIEGRDVNLAALLIQDFDVDSKKSKQDNRLKRRLNIEQFRVAFGKYRRVMSAKWPHRQHELECYEIDIANIHSFYGDRFYDYHLAFSRKAAAAVKLRIPIDWSKRDTELFQLILGGVRVNQCSKYHSPAFHDPEFCDSATRITPTLSNGTTSDNDKYGFDAL